jgi:hypothetical protein
MANYREMSVPFESLDAANDALKAFKGSAPCAAGKESQLITE